MSSQKYIYNYTLYNTPTFLPKMILYNTQHIDIHEIMCQFNCLGEGWYVRISNGIGPFRNAAQAAGTCSFQVTME